MKFLIPIFFVLFLADISARPDKLSMVSRELIKGTVPVVSTKQLAKDIKDESKTRILLLDSREKREYEVSHLKGAVWVGYEDFNILRLNGVKKDTNIVVYCSVGYRSEKVGEKLKAAGFVNVRNLFAGIFAWANEGRPMEDEDSKMTQAVHGYDLKWSEFLSHKVPKVLK